MIMMSDVAGRQSNHPYQVAMEDNQVRQYCTFAVTGQQKAKQAVFVCRSCAAASESTRPPTASGPDDPSSSCPRTSESPDEVDAPLLCICQACAELCHRDHDGLEYIGFGAAYCDCRDHHGPRNGCGCQLAQVSDDAVARMNLTRPHGEVQDDGAAATTGPGSYRMEAYAIQELVDDEPLCRQLHRSACELVQSSKETFWVDPANIDTAMLCDLEKLALAVYRYHAACATTQDLCGAEWWVQVKPAHDPDAGAVDLHYDKDEAVAESFGLGYFPYLSTVTYLSGCPVESEDGPTIPGGMPLAPTIVLSRVYGDNPNDGSEEVEVLFSHPRRGKHLAFDGRLLHGAPGAQELRESHSTTTQAAASDLESTVEASNLRVTFLVNLWSNHKPANVSELPSDVRAALVASGSSKSNVGLGDVSFRRLHVPERRVSSAADLCSEEPLYLPFVSRNATWAAVPEDEDEDEDDDEEELVLSILVPSAASNLHTVLCRFDADHGPFLTSPEDGENDNGDSSRSDDLDAEG